MEHRRAGEALDAVRSDDRERGARRVLRAQDGDIAGEGLARAAFQIVAAIAVDARAGVGGRGQELAARLGIAFGKAVERHRTPHRQPTGMMPNARRCGQLVLSQRAA